MSSLIEQGPLTAERILVDGKLAEDPRLRDWARAHRRAKRAVQTAPAASGLVWIKPA